MIDAATIEPKKETMGKLGRYQAKRPEWASVLAGREDEK
jgi:hypothetical protein